ncbi:MAG: TonB-dependent receptor family protein [Crocinitomicaceae bacterium]|nr:TonB-dependent receptor family protein [Crocinitomicaceae bacterium]
MQLKRYLLAFVVLLSLNSAFGQQPMRVEGTVYDTTGTKPLLNAVAVAVRIKDSLLLDFARTDASGHFVLDGFPVDTFTLIISHPQFDDKTYYMFGHADNFDIKIPSITMPSKAQELDEVIIYAYKDPIYYKGDTLVYVADSFATSENAVVEDLLKKLPGLEVGQDGTLKSQGKEISQVLVDGDEFFGSDPTIATKNLGAKGVETVQVYEKKQENAGEGEETIQVLDLRLKDDAKKGYFGRVSGGTDFDQFYEGELLVNKFNKSQKISVFMLTANTPKSEFGFGDRSKFGLENEGNNRRFDDDGIFVDFNDGQNSGIPKTLKAGVYYTDKLGEKKNHTLGFNYSYYNTRLNSISRSRSQYFVGDSTFYSDDSTRNESFDEQHRINFKYEGKLDSLTRLEIRPSANLSNATQVNKDYSTWRDANDSISRVNQVFNDNASNSTSLSGDVRLERKFMKKRRQLNVRYIGSYQDDAAEGVLSSDNRYTFLNSNDSLEQQKLNSKISKNHSGALTYYEPLGDKFKIQLDYQYDYGFNNQNKETRQDFNPLTGQYDSVNPIFTNNFDNLRQSNRAGAILWWESRKHTIDAGLRVRNVLIDNTNLFTDAVIQQNVTNYLPTFTYRYRPNQSKRLTVRYRTNSQLPAITDLQPIPDNTNPNRVKVGNPNLLPNFQHNFDVSFNTYNALKGRYIYVGMNGQITQNGFGDSTAYIANAFGVQQSKTVNVDGNYYAVGYAGAGLPFFNRVFMLRPNFSSFISQSTSYIDGEKNTTLSRTASANIDYAFMWDSLDITLRNSFNYNSPISSLASFNTQPFTTQSYFASISWRLPHGFKIETNANYTINGQRSNGYNINFLIWNAAIYKYFLKTQNLEVSVLMNDILNQNIAANRSVSQNVVTDNFTKIISRYFLVKTTLRFNNRKAKEEDEKGWF